MEGFRESGSYYDVPSDNINLECKGGMDDGSYDAGRYMKKQRQMAYNSEMKLKKEKYDESRYSGK